MIKYVNTLITHRTMFGTLTRDGNIAQMAPSVFNNMGMLTSVEFWYWPFRVQGPQMGVGGIQNFSYGMRNEMADK